MDDAASDGQGSAGRRRGARHGDLAWAAAGMAVAAAGAWVLPAGAPLRLVATVPALLVAPGYLLLQAGVHPRRASHRRRDAVVAVGLSPVVVGLAALATAIVPGGFRTGPIVAAVAIACWALAWVAWRRRVRHEASRAASRAARAPAAESAPPEAPAQQPG